MIFSIEHIDKIIKKEKMLQKSFEKDNYIRESFKIVNPTLVDHMGEDYLLHKAYFIEEDTDNNEVFHPITFTDIEDRQDDTCKYYIHIAEGLVKKEKNTTTFTKIILDKHIQGLVLYNGKQPHKIGNIVSQDLKSKNRLVELAKKLNVNVKEIELLLERYTLLSKENSGSFYAYFIRPFADHKLYNGIFLILLKRPLTESEFLEIGYLWTKILSETALLNIERYVQGKAQEYIFEEQTHLWNGEINSILQHLDVVSKRVEYRDSDMIEEIISSIKYAFHKTQQLQVIHGFNLFLLKTKGIKSWNEVADIEGHIRDKNILNQLEIKPVNIIDIILQSIET